MRNHALRFGVTVLLMQMLVVSPRLWGQGSNETPEVYYVKYKGTIGNSYKVSMDLMREGKELTGTYYYDKIGTPLFLEGSISDTGSFEMVESDKGLKITGVFKGSISSDSRHMEGKWVNQKTNEEMKFSLDESLDEAAAIHVNKLVNENCLFADMNKRKPAGEINYMWDTVCSVIRLEMMEVECKNTKISDKINQALTAAVCGSMNGYYTSVDSLMNSIMKLQEGEFLDKMISCALLINDAEILSICVWQSEFSGGAHPVSVADNMSFDLVTGKQISLDDILKPGYEGILNAVGEKIFTDTYGSEGWFFTPGQFELNNNFALTMAGLQYTWDQYEIGPYVYGMPEILIPYKEIRDLIRSDGPLNRVCKVQ